MSVQPIMEIPPSIPPPQTNNGVLQHNSSIVMDVERMPGEQPDMLIHMARMQLVGSFTITTTNEVGDIVYGTNAIEIPFVPTIQSGSTALDLARHWPAYSSQVYMNQTRYWNAQVNYLFWAVKPPMAVGRTRLIYKPPNSLLTYDDNQREITKEWDMSQDNQFMFSINGYNPLNMRHSVALPNPNSPVQYPARTNLNDYKLGYIQMRLTNKYQPGSVFPETCYVYVFQSFTNPQFKVVRGPPLLREESALTDLFSSQINP